MVSCGFHLTPAFSPSLSFFAEIKQQKNKSMFWSVPDMRSVVENSLIFLEQRSYIVGGIDGDGAGPLV